MVTISNVKARDIMQAHVVTLSPSTSIESAIETFEDLHISGAPVVDERGTIVGMLSAFDIAKTEHMQDDQIQVGRVHYAEMEIDEEEEPLSFDEVILTMNDFSPRTTGRTTVAEWMTREIVSVGPDMGLRQICKLMVKEHVHRVPVVKNGKLVGIISTLDIVRCVARDFSTREEAPPARVAKTATPREATRAPKSPPAPTKATAAQAKTASAPAKASAAALNASANANASSSNASRAAKASRK